MKTMKTDMMMVIHFMDLFGSTGLPSGPIWVATVPKFLVLQVLKNRDVALAKMLATVMRMKMKTPVKAPLVVEKLVKQVLTTVVKDNPNQLPEAKAALSCKEAQTQRKSGNCKIKKSIGRSG